MIKHTNSFKLKVIDEYKKNGNRDYILNKYRIPRSTFYDWLNFFKEKEEAKSLTDYLKLQIEYEKLKRTLEIIQKTRCFPDSPRQQKLEAVEKLVGQYPIKEICRIIELPHGTFYNYHLRRVKEKQNDKRNEELKPIVRRIFEESCQRFSAIKTYQKMKSEGYKVSREKVSELMKVMGLKSKHHRKRSFIQKKTDNKYLKNKLNKNFNQTNPNKFWISDTTSIWVGKTLFWMCVILDLFSRKVIAYRISMRDDTRLIINTFKEAFEKRNRPVGLTFNSNRGKNYISEEFRSLLYSVDVSQSCSKKGNPYDSAVIESFFSSMKREELNSHNFEKLEEVEKCVAEYMEFYNNYRPHNSLKNKTPEQVEREFFDCQSD